jgi:hypothetical protein
MTADVAAPGLCKAWVIFNGTGTVAIRAAFNVSSIQDSGTGDYTINFTTAMPDVDYTFLCAARNTAFGSTVAQPVPDTVLTTSAIRVISFQSTTGNLFDVTYAYAAVFR